MKKLSSKSYNTTVMLLVLLSALSLLLFLRSVIVVLFFIFLNGAISSYKRVIKLPIEIELVTLGVVISTVLFGIKAGLAVAILGGVTGFVVGFNISPFSFPMLAGYISMAFISEILLGIGIDFQAVGVLASLLNNLIVFLAYHFLFRYDMIKNISFSVSNLIWNAAVFLNIAPILLDLLKTFT